MSCNLKHMKLGTSSQIPPEPALTGNPCRHLVDLILESDRENPLFRSPIGADRERDLQVLDIGTGQGTWAM